MLLTNKNKIVQKQDPIIEELVIRLRSEIVSEEEYEEIKETLIEKLLYLCKRISRRYILMYNQQHLEEDIIACGVLGLVKAVNSARSKLKDNNITGIVTMKIHSIILELLKKELKVYSKKTLNTCARNAGGINHEIKVWEIREDLKPMLKSELEKRIMELKFSEYTDDEIAEITGFTRQHIQIVRNIILRRIRFHEKSL